MSAFDENGNGGGFVPTWGAVGAECTECFVEIDKAEGGRLYSFNGEYLCKSCLEDLLKSHKYARQGNCSKCDAEGVTVLPHNNKAVCLDCIFDFLDGINADDPANE